MERSRVFTEYTNNKSSWDIRVTPALRTVKRYLKEMDFGNMTKHDVIKRLVDICRNSGNVQRLLIHLTIFLHSNHPDTEYLLEDEDLYPLIPVYKKSGLSVEDYDSLIRGVGLDPDFMYEEASSVNVPKEEETDASLLERLLNSDLSVLKTEELRGRRDGLIMEVFRDGVHNRFEKPGLIPFLGSVRTSLRRISLGSDLIEKNTYIDDLYVCGFQNPIMTSVALVGASVRTQNCVLLRELKVFLDLNIGEGNADSLHPSTTNVLELGIFKLLFGLYQADPMWQFMMNGLSILIDEGFIKASKLLHLLQLLTIEFGKLEALENMAKSMKLFRTLFFPALEQGDLRDEELVEFRSFVRMLQHVTYVCDKDKASLSVRECCIAILRRLDKYLVEKNGESSINTELSELNVDSDGSTHSLGLLYIRCPEKRASVRHMVMREAESPKWSTIDAFKEITSDVIGLIDSSSRAEWEPLTIFLVKVVFPHKPILHQSGLHNFMTRVLSIAFQSRSLPTSIFLAYYEFYLNFMRTDDVHFASNYDIQLDVIRTLVSLICCLYCDEAKPDQKKPGHCILLKKSQVAGRIFTILYDTVDWAQKQKVIYPADVKVNILKTLELIPKVVPPGSTCGCMMTYNKIMSLMKEM